MTGHPLMGSCVNYGFPLAKDTAVYRYRFLFYHLHLEAQFLYRDMWGGA